MSARLVRLETAPDLLEQVDRRPIEAISEGMLASGQRITQDDSADQLAVSRQPVLQAFCLLNGFVQDGRAAENLARELHGVLSAPPRPAPR